MIILKNEAEIELLKKACGIAAEALKQAGQMVSPGVKTSEIDRHVKAFIESCGAKPSFLGYGGFPASACISIDSEVIHGIPGDRVIEEGNIVSIDVGAFIGGFHGDCANTFPAGKCGESALRLIEVTRNSFFEGIKFAKPGYRIGDIGSAISSYVEKAGYSAVRDYVGHGVGRNLHEDPQVPNYGQAGKGARIENGMTLAIEPMINAGGYAVKQLSDKWTIVTADGGLSAHYENTIAIIGGEPLILTIPFSEEC